MPQPLMPKKLNGSMMTYKTFENLPPHKNVHVNVIAAYSESQKKKNTYKQPRWPLIDGLITNCYIHRIEFYLAILKTDLSDTRRHD